jgi:hypothetical protein
LADDQYPQRVGASIHCLMLLAGRDFEPFAGVNHEVMMLYFECEFSFQYEEKLPCVNMGVANLAGAGWHELFDDAEFGCFDEVPTVAVRCLRASPFVVFGGSCADDLCWQLSFT